MNRPATNVAVVKRIVEGEMKCRRRTKRWLWQTEENRGEWTFKCCSRREGRQGTQVKQVFHAVCTSLAHRPYTVDGWIGNAHCENGKRDDMSAWEVEARAPHVDKGMAEIGRAHV